MWGISVQQKLNYRHRRQTARHVLKVSQGHQTIGYVRYVFLLVYYSNFVPKTRRFFRYSTSDNNEFETPVLQLSDPNAGFKVTFKESDTIR